MSFTTINETVPPTVVDQFPANAAPAAPINTLITATFSEPMDSSTVDDTTGCRQLVVILARIIHEMHALWARTRA